jgi:mono/diheme cytochrome c family protein
MRSLRFKQFVAVMALAASAGCVAALAQAPKWNEIGQPMTADEMKAMAKDSGPSGKDLPPGRGTAKEGERIYMTRCSMCHGIDLKGHNAAPGSLDFLQGAALVGGKGVPLYGPNGPSSVSRAWYAAYPTTMWNIIAISMPFFKPGSLSTDEVYSLVAFILAKNEIIKEDMVMDRETLPKVKMPRHDDYVPANFDDILDINKRACFKTYAICEPMGQK